MTSLIPAIIAAFTANSGLMTLCPGGIQRAPARRPTFDYVTVSDLPGPTSPTYGNHALGDVPVTFNAFSNKGGVAAAAIGDAIVAFFKANVLSLASGKITNIVLIAPPAIMPQPSKDGGGSTVVKCSVQFRYSVEHY
jgi:hypothetical protein